MKTNDTRFTAVVKQVSPKKIASIIGVHPSTTCRELKCNKGKKGYRPKQANGQALERKTKANSSNENSDGDGR